MKRYKVMFLLGLVLFLSGCTAEYNLNITKNNIQEENIIYIENSSRSNIKEDVENLVNRYTGPTNSLGMYSQSIVQNGNVFGVSYKANYDLLGYNDSISFSNCYDSYKLINDENRIIIATSKKFKCFEKYTELEEVVVNLTTDLKVVSTNADTIKEGKYIWNITKENASDKSIRIELDNQVPGKKIDNLSLIIFVGCFIAIILIIILLIFLKNKKNNRL